MFAVKGVGLLAFLGLTAGAASALAASPADSAAAAAAAAQRLAAVRAAAAQASPDNPYAPPACTGIFTDVACPSGFAVNWIEQFSHDGITAGCGGGLYCPDNPVTRAQMAVFVEKAMHGTGTWSPGNLGSENTGLGDTALLNGSGYAHENTAIGYAALQTQSFANGNATYYSDNTAVGAYSLFNNQPDGGNGGLNGTQNTGVGDGALSGNTTGYNNTGVGFGAGGSFEAGFGNTFVGAGADADTSPLSDATAIGAGAVVDASYHVRIGDANVTQIGGEVAWSNLSDARAKNDVRDLALGLDFVMALRPVSYTLKQGNGRTDMGFVAQDVEALLGTDYNVLGIGGDANRTLSLRYTDFIAPMVKAIQDQQAQLAAKDARIAELEKRQAAQRADIEALKSAVAALVQKASVAAN